MFKELFGASNIGSTKEKGIAGITGVQVNVITGEKSLVKQKSQSKSKFSNYSMPSIEQMEEEVNANKENKVYKVNSNIDVMKKKSAGTLQYSDFIASD